MNNRWVRGAVIPAAAGVLAAFGATAARSASLASGAMQRLAGPVLASGGSHTCALGTQASAFCWGDNRRGQLGDGTTMSRNSPVSVAGGLSFTALAAGGEHTCGLTAEGSAWCWGFNTGGQLGDGTTGSRSRPVAVVGGLRFTALAAGSFHSCGLTTDGAAHCWGANSTGQLGDGTKGDRGAPVAVLGDLRFTVLAAGDWHTCALTATGSAWCWGQNTSGQLGDGPRDEDAEQLRTRPVAVAGDLRFRDLVAGDQHTCGLTAQGSAYCWGQSMVGQLGGGTAGSPVRQPAAVSGALSFAVLSAGGSHTCGLTAQGSAYCWGWNGFSEVGDGTMEVRNRPVVVAGAPTYAALSAGAGHTCGLTSAGSAVCWGSNAYGQLGEGTGERIRARPVAVAGGIVFRVPGAGSR